MVREMSVALPVKPKTRPAKKAGVELARQAFIYQGITDTGELAKAGNVSKNTIWNHINAWKDEREQMLAKQSGIGLQTSLSVPSETLEKHKEDINFIRKRLDKSKSDLDNLPEIVSDLREIVKQFASDPDKLDDALHLLDKFLRISANEKAQTKLFMDLKTLWDAKSGVDSLKNIQEAAGKAVAVASAKSGDEPVKEEIVSVGGVFGKRA